MMNATILSQLVNAIAQMDDAQGIQVLTVCNGILSLAQAPTQAPNAPAPAPKPAPARKVAESGVDVTLTSVAVSDKNALAFTVPYGDGRKAAKAALRDAGFKWDESIRAYVGTTAQGKALGLSKRKTVLTITKEALQASWDKAAARAAKRGA